MTTANRVWETSATTGTGSLTLAGAVANYRTFNAALGADVRFTYWIDNEAGAWETGIGYMSDATTLVRETPLDGSAATPVSFTGTLQVYVASSDSNLMPAYGVVPSGTIFPSVSMTEQVASTVLTANRVYYMPFLWAGSQPINALGVKINTLVTLSFRLGLYQNNKGNVGNLIDQTATLVDVAGTFITGSITTLSLPAGWYFIALVADGNMNMKGSVSSTTNLLGMKDIGSNSENYGYYRDTADVASVILPTTPNTYALIADLNVPKLAVVVA